MEDQKILELYWDRDEQAIVETQIKYGKWCTGIAYRILESQEDTEECVADTFMSAWDHIPPQRPTAFRAWIGKVTRNLALSRYRKQHAGKRGSGEVALALEELGDCVSGDESPEGSLDRELLYNTINTFLGELDQLHRVVFMRRYWYLDPIAQIAGRYDMSVNQVNSLLYRLRQQLRSRLEEEGIAV